MNIDDKRNNISSNLMQNLVLENREKISISGVNDVLSFDDQIVILETGLGLLTIKGENLRINKLSLDSEEVIIEGNINSLSYSEKEIERKNSSILNKIFR
jgi:sporulation protein YabP